MQFKTIWKIDRLYTNNVDKNIVTLMQYSVFGFDESKPDDEPSVLGAEVEVELEYNNLTESKAIEEVKKALGTMSVKNIEEQLKQEIIMLNQPKHEELDIPWESEESNIDEDEVISNMEPIKLY